MTAEIIRVRIDVFVKQILNSAYTQDLLEKMADDDIRTLTRRIMM